LFSVANTTDNMTYGAIILKIFILVCSAECIGHTLMTTYKECCHKERIEDGHKSVNRFQIE